MRKEAGGHHGWAECDCTPEPPAPPSLPAWSVAVLCHYSDTVGLWLLPPLLTLRAAGLPALARQRRSSTQIPRQLLAYFCQFPEKCGAGTGIQAWVIGKEPVVVSSVKYLGSGLPVDTCELSMDKVNGKHLVPGERGEMEPWPCENGELLQWGVGLPTCLQCWGKD